MKEKKIYQNSHCENRFKRGINIYKKITKYINQTLWKSIYIIKYPVADKKKAGNNIRFTGFMFLNVVTWIWIFIYWFTISITFMKCILMLNNPRKLKHQMLWTPLIFYSLFRHFLWQIFRLLYKVQEITLKLATLGHQFGLP